MATIAVRPPRLYQAGYSIPPIVRTATEADSQTFKAGHLVYLNTSGELAAATDASTIAGIALDNATNVTSGNATIRFIEIRPGDVYVINTKTSASSVVMGAKYGVEAPASLSEYTLDPGDTTHTAMIVVGFHPDDAASDTYARVLVRFTADYCQLAQG